MSVTNTFVIATGVTAICLFILLLFPFVLYMRDIKEHTKNGKTFMESVATTIIWHLLLSFFFAFFFTIWGKIADFNKDKDATISDYSPKIAVQAFLDVNNSEKVLFAYWKKISGNLISILEQINKNEEGDGPSAVKGKKFVTYSVGLIVLLGLIYSVVLFILPIFCILVPIFLSARHDKLHRDNNSTMLFDKARYLVYGIVTYIIMGMHLYINDIFIMYVVADENTAWKAGSLHKKITEQWDNFKNEGFYWKAGSLQE